MFICKPCLDKRDLPATTFDVYPKSYGSCEVCGEIHACIDYHGYLPPVKAKVRWKIK